MLSSSRKGINLSESELSDLDGLVTPLLKNGQSLAHIYAKHKDEIPCTSRTLYNYARQSIITAIPLDFPRIVRYKKRRKQTIRSYRNPAIRQNRTYEDFQKFLLENSDVSVIEMDTVIGRIGGKTLLTMLFRNSRFQLAFLINSNTQKQVISVFNSLEHVLDTTCFQKTFPVFLTDNGSEFLDPVSLEADGRTKIFYCNPNAPFQKGAIEKNHEFIRYILPKGTSFDSLQQEDINLMLNHINSTARDSLNEASPFDLAKILLGQKVLDSLKMERIEHDKVILKPSLLKNKSKPIIKENS
jgi:IS30 family transposase